MGGEEAWGEGTEGREEEEEEQNERGTAEREGRRIRDAGSGVWVFLPWTRRGFGWVVGVVCCVKGSYTLQGEVLLSKEGEERVE